MEQAPSRSAPQADRIVLWQPSPATTGPGGGRNRPWDRCRGEGAQVLRKPKQERDDCRYDHSTSPELKLSCPYRVGFADVLVELDAVADEPAHGNVFIRELFGV